MPAESKAAEAAPATTNPSTPKKKPASSSGKAALAKVTVLDGSILEVTIDVSSVGFQTIDENVSNYEF